MHVVFFHLGGASLHIYTALDSVAQSFFGEVYLSERSNKEGATSVDEQVAIFEEISCVTRPWLWSCVLFFNSAFARTVEVFYVGVVRRLFRDRRGQLGDRGKDGDTAGCNASSSIVRIGESWFLSSLSPPFNNTEVWFLQRAQSESAAAWRSMWRWRRAAPHADSHQNPLVSCSVWRE